MTLVIVGFYFMLKLSKQPTFGSLFALGMVFFVFFPIRWYIPALMVMAGVIWGILYLRGRQRYLLLSWCLIGGLFIVGILGYLNSWSVRPFLPYLDQLGSPAGMIRALLSPQPWSISSEYSFLLLPSVLHWLLFLPALLGGWMLWRRSREAALLLIYLALILLLYGFIPEQQGPRHRLQVAFIIAWMQFHFFWVMIREAVSQVSLARTADTFHEGKFSEG